MYFALGFLVMGLLGLLFLPFYWRRAVRLSTRRLEAQLPLSMREIHAERDSLRAEFAAETRRIEQRAEAAVQARLIDRVELGRRTAALSALEAGHREISEKAISLEAALVSAERFRREAEAGLSAAIIEIHDANGQAAKVSGDYQDLSRQYQDLLRHTDSQRATIAALDTRATGLDIRLEDMKRTLENTEAARESRGQETKLVEASLAATNLALAEWRRKHGALDAEHSQAQDVIANLEVARQEADTAIADAKAALAGADERAGAAVALHAEALRREKDLRASLQRQMDMARASDANLAKRVDTLRSDNAQLLARIDELQAIPASVAPAIAGEIGDLGLLRSAITDLGKEMTRLTGALAQEDANADTPPAERLRQLQARASRRAMTGG